MEQDNSQREHGELTGYRMGRPKVCFPNGGRVPLKIFLQFHWRKLVVLALTITLFIWLIRIG
ncbi:MAG TPA: hypothetical protein DDW36_04545 [Candidatus Magasanikbacteria bacterium]|nr:hypothetical protein [Candidatus Magasanikbacteria bacterium]